MPHYSRDNPSPAYRELIRLHDEMHRVGAADQGLTPDRTFPGVNLLMHSQRLREIVSLTNARTLLDYGAGKGLGWSQPVSTQDGQTYPELLSFLGLASKHCYDPCYEPFAQLPTGERFDGVVAMDVLEHCPEEDMQWILDEIFSFANKFVFASIACYPARKTLIDGRNAHATVRPAEWWEELIDNVASHHPDLRWEFLIISPTEPWSSHADQNVYTTLGG